MTKIANAAIVGLFYYQIWAHLICSYNYFLLSKEFDRVSHQNIEVWIERFYQDHNWSNFGRLAWKNDWFRILFLPWTFFAAEELLIVKVSS